jgi:hypothetical protein
MGTDEHEERPDPGGVPRTLFSQGYRSVSPLVAYAAFGVVIVVMVLVLWSILSHPRAAFAAPPSLKVQPTPDSLASILPDPTDPPFHMTPRIHPVVRLVSPTPVKVASASSTSVSTESLGPPGESPARLVADADDRRLADARYASTRMQLDTQDNAAQDHSALSPAVDISHGDEIAASNGIRTVAQSGAPHSLFLEERNGNPGYEEETSPYELVTGTNRQYRARRHRQGADYRIHFR